MKIINSFNVIILSYNDGFMLERLLQDLKIVENVLVVDSYSTDNTQEIVESYKRQFVQYEFVNQAVQINNAVRQHFAANDWLLRLDSDERVSSNLLLEIDALIKEKEDFVGYIDRKMYWMGKRLKFSGLSKHYIGRIYQPKNAEYEEVTEEHLVHDCKSVKLRNTFYEDNIKNNIEFFVKKHLVTAKGEVNELMKSTQVDSGILFTGKAHLVRRYLKVNVYNQLPIFLRGILYFMYRYFIKGGFMDGRAGFSFCFFQAFFYRMLIDQIYWEQTNDR
ncbi:glycosyltransferase family 2 protein [Planktomarina temperata]|nr:glycosyltransferase family 2 protein [Planktomarina temperata]